jgi:hypothetical protein
MEGYAVKVNIEHVEEKQGFFKKTTYYGVKCDVTFSEEELQIIKAQELDNVVVLERERPAHINDDRLPPEAWFLRIGSLVAKHKTPYMCASVKEAKVYEEELVEALGDLKQYIIDNAEIDEKKKSFEL